MGDRPEDFGMSTLSGYCQFVTKAQFNPLIDKRTTYTQFESNLIIYGCSLRL